MCSDVSFGVNTSRAGYANRRESRRRVRITPAKVYDERAERYYPAETTNLSAGGALIKVNRSMPICRGDRLSIGILRDFDLPEEQSGSAPVRQTSVLRREDFEPATVVRVTPIDPCSQAIAIQFVRFRREEVALDPVSDAELAFNAVVHAVKPRTGARRPAAAA